MARKRSQHRAERGGEEMISNKKALECAETLIKFCEEQRGCQNCIFRKYGCDRWCCHIEAIDLKYAIDEVKEHIEAKKRNGGYL